jgi:hypothetical protein
VRQFLDDVQFAVGNEIGEVMRDVQRGIRDEFTDRISELSRTYVESAQQAQRAAREDGESSARRGLVLRGLLDRVQQAGSTLTELVAL